jgi:hypothetical protein
MAEKCYTARVTVKQQVLDGIKKLTLYTYKLRHYTHNAILLLQKGIWHMLASHFNPSYPGKGMEKLLDNDDNCHTLGKLTDAITAGSMIKMSKNQEHELLTTTGKTVLPAITSQTKPQKEAEQWNIINKLVLGVKEGIVKAITKLVGSNITGTILQTAKESNHKRINNFTLFNLMKMGINGADRPPTNC